VRALELSYRLDFATSLHVGTGMGFTKMVDDTICRAGPALGRGAQLPCVPGSSMKGKVRSRCEALARSLGLRLCEKGERVCKQRPCIICRLFGSAYTPGRLRFSDALLTEPWCRLARPEFGHEVETARNPFILSSVRMGNKLERATRTVEQDLLFSLEYTADRLQFGGSIQGYLDDRTFAGDSLTLPVEAWLLLVGLQLVDKLGGGRSRGLGRCRITLSSLTIDGGENLADDLPARLLTDENLLGLSMYETSS
jgi:CRISPR/Cas system CSM-associated protein Csm3 (group 7 of RAMP superfamily)